MDSLALPESQGEPIKYLTIEDLLNPLLHAMHSLGGSANNRQIEKNVIQHIRIAKKLMQPSTPAKSGKKGKSIYSHHLGYAKTYLKDFDVLENPSPGIWSLTQRGTQTLQVDPQEVKQAYRKQLRRRKMEREAKKEAKEPQQNKAETSAEIVFDVQETLRQRRSQRPEGSYTAELFAAGLARIAQKVGEESLEVIIAALHESRERQIAEVADLLAHLLILLVELNIPLEEILSELQRRHESPTE